jgi:hypothetical protein
VIFGVSIAGWTSIELSSINDANNGDMMNRPKWSISVTSVLGVLTVLAFLAVMLLSRTNSSTRIDLPPPVTLKPLATWTDELILNSDEPPSGWRLGGLAWQDVLGTPSRSYWFKHLPTAPLGTALSEEFSVHSTTELAKQTYPRVIDKFFPSAYGNKGWTTVPELAIQDHADETTIQCLRETINGSPSMACRSIARYQNVIVQVNGIVHPDQWLTLSDFRQMLEAVDRRVTKVLAQVP